MATSVPATAQWFRWVVDDLRPTPGRFESSLRIVLTVVVALMLMLTL